MRHTISSSIENITTVKSAELNTERLTLRPMRESDIDAVFAYRSDAETNKYQGWVPTTPEDVAGFLDTKTVSILNVQGTWFQFVVVRKDTGELIGDIGLHFFDPENRQVEIGCTIGKGHQRQGFAFEALTEVVNFLFTTLNKHRVIASVDPRNVGSVRLMKKLGLRQEAHFRESLLFGGQWVDDLIFALLKKEWQANN